jgi:hypothetical protein
MNSARKICYPGWAGQEGLYTQRSSELLVGFTGSRFKMTLRSRETTEGHYQLRDALEALGHSRRTADGEEGTAPECLEDETGQAEDWLTVVGGWG